MKEIIFLTLLSFLSTLFFIFLFFLKEYFDFQNDYFEKKIVDSIYASEVIVLKQNSRKIITFKNKLPFQTKNVLRLNYFMNLFDVKSQEKIRDFLRKWRNEEIDFLNKKLLLNIKVLDFEQKWYLTFIKKKSNVKKITFVLSNLNPLMNKKKKIMKG